MAVYVRPKWWLPGIIACGVVFLIGFFIPNNAVGWTVVILALIGAAVLGFIEYKGRKESTTV